LDDFILIWCLILRPLLIPWADIKDIRIINSITDETNLLTETMNKLSLNSYVKINLLNLKDFFIIIRWKDEYNKKVPKEKMVNS